MYCTQCGNRLRPEDRFCGACGAAVQDAPATDQMASDPPEPDPDWRDSADFAHVLNQPEVVALIDQAEGTHEKGMSASEFLSVSAPILTAIGVKGVPLRTIAEVVPSWGAKMGVKTGKTADQTFDLSIGRVIAAVSCSLAARNLPLIEGEQAADGCVLKAKIGSSMWTFGGELTVTLARARAGAGARTRVEAAAVIPGQMFDWGASKQHIRELFEDIPRYARLQTPL